MVLKKAVRARFQSYWFSTFRGNSMTSWREIDFTPLHHFFRRVPLPLAIMNDEDTIMVDVAGFEDPNPSVKEASENSSKRRSSSIAPQQAPRKRWKPPPLNPKHWNDPTPLYSRLWKTPSPVKSPPWKTWRTPSPVRTPSPRSPNELVFTTSIDSTTPEEEDGEPLPIQRLSPHQRENKRKMRFSFEDAKARKNPKFGFPGMNWCISRTNWCRLFIFGLLFFPL